MYCMKANAQQSRKIWTSVGSTVELGYQISTDSLDTKSVNIVNT